MTATKTNQRVDKWVEEAITNYTQDRGVLTPCTISGYRDSIHVVVNRLERAELPTNPRKITRSDTKAFIEDLITDGLSVKTCKCYIQALHVYCEGHNNFEPSQVRQRWPHDCRPNVDWLSNSKALKLVTADLGVEGRLLVHLELCLGLRRIDAIRLETGFIDFDNKTLKVLGKGHANGKVRIVPFVTNEKYKTMDSETVFREYLEYRDTLVRLALSERPNQTVTNKLIVFKKGDSVRPYSETGTAIDNKMRAVSVSTGVKLSNHTLRRTFGRNLFSNGVKIEDIAVIMGHSSTNVTLMYLGLDRLDQSSNMNRLSFEDD